MEELAKYVVKYQLTIKEDVLTEMFQEAIQGRAIIHEKQRGLPLTLEEI